MSILVTICLIKYDRRRPLYPYTQGKGQGRQVGGGRLKSVGIFRCQSYFCQPVFDIFGLKNIYFWLKLITHSGAFRRGYEIHHANFTSIRFHFFWLSRTVLTVTIIKWHNNPHVIHCALTPPPHLIVFYSVHFYFVLLFICRAYKFECSISNIGESHLKSRRHPK